MEHAQEVEDAPAGDHRVIEHDGGRDEADERTHPGEAWPGDGCEGADDAEPAAPSEGVLGDDQRDAPGEQENKPGDKERPRAVLAGVLRGDARKAPDIARADRDAEHAEQQREARGEAVVAHVQRDGGRDQPSGSGPWSMMISRCPLQVRVIASGVPMAAARGSPQGPNQWFWGAPVVRARSPQ